MITLYINMFSPGFGEILHYSISMLMVYDEMRLWSRLGLADNSYCY